MGVNEPFAINAIFLVLKSIVEIIYQLYIIYVGILVRYDVYSLKIQQMISYTKSCVYIIWINGCVRNIHDVDFIR